LGIGKHEHFEDWKFNGKAPLLLEAISENSLLSLLGSQAADQAILTRTSAEKQ